MGKSTFIQTVKVEPTEVQKDKAIINDYLNNGQYLDSGAIEYLKKIKSSIELSYFMEPGLKEKMRRISYTDIVADNRLRMTWVKERIPNEICDDEYKTLIEALKKECETTLSDYQNRSSEDEKKLKSNIDGLYSAVCDLIEFHKKRQDIYEQAYIREKLRNISKRIKTLGNEWPDNLPNNLDLSDPSNRESIDIQSSNIEKLINELERYTRGILYYTREQKKE